MQRAQQSAESDEDIINIPADTQASVDTEALTRARKPGHCPRQRDQLYYYISQSEALNNEPTHASIPAVANQLADIKVESQEAADELAVFSVHKRAGRSHQRTGQSHPEV
jgi:hypothetical protein